MPTVFAMMDSFSVVHDRVLNGTSVLTNDMGTNLTASLVSGPTQGTLTLNTNGTFQYTPPVNYTGSASFVYQAAASGQTSNATVSINITNFAPTFTGQSLSLIHDRVLDNINLLANALDADNPGETLTSTVVTGPSHGSLTQNANGTYKYTPTIHYTGSDSFTAKVSDGVAFSSVATFTINVTNLAPTASSNGTPLSVLRSTWTTDIDLTGYASDSDGDNLLFTIVGQPSHGQLYEVSDAVYTYRSNAGYSGLDSFTFKANDGVANSNTATFSLTIYNDAPAAANTSIYYVRKNQTLSIADLTTYGNSASTTSFSITIVQQPTQGQLVSVGGGQYQYTAPNSVVSDSFTYKLNDGVTDSNVATASISVVDQPIVANGVRRLISALDPVSFSASDLFVNAQSSITNPSFQVISIATPVSGQITNNQNGTWIYTPPEKSAPGFQDTFAFTISDGVNNGTATFTMLVPDRRTNVQRRLEHMQNRTNLFPAGFSLAAWTNQAQAAQMADGLTLSNSVQQGYRYGDSTLAAALIAELRQPAGGMGFLGTNVEERLRGVDGSGLNPNEVLGYRVNFYIPDPNNPNVADRTWFDVVIPTNDDREWYGCTTDGSLWYTVFEMGYRQTLANHQQRTTIGNYSQPVVSGADSLLAMKRAVSGFAGQSFVLANLTDAALNQEMIRQFAVMTVNTLATFTPAQQTIATNLGFERGTSYAVVGYTAGGQGNWDHRVFVWANL